VADNAVAIATRGLSRTGPAGRLADRKALGSNRAGAQATCPRPCALALVQRALDCQPRQALGPPLVRRIPVGRFGVLGASITPGIRKPRERAPLWLLCPAAALLTRQGGACAAFGARHPAGDATPRTDRLVFHQAMGRWSARQAGWCSTPTTRRPEMERPFDANQTTPPTTDCNHL